MKLVEVKERWLMCWLCFMGRGVTQAVRVVLGALMPYIATDLELDHKQKGTVLAAFAAGYMCTQVLGGYASDRYGGRGPILFAMGSLGFVFAVAPWCADTYGPNGLAGCLFVMGLCEGPSYPSMGTMLGRWIPAHERSKAVSISDTGSSLGSMLTFAIAPPLAALYGWRATMRMWAYSCLLSTAIWYKYATNGPDESLRISVRELEYLRQHGLGKAPHHGKGGRNAPFPYALFKFSQTWAVIVAHAAFNFGRYFVYNSLLQFYVDELGTTAVAAGQHILVGQIFDCIGKFGFAPFADRDIRTNPSSRTRVRKVISGVAFVAFALSMAGFAACTTVSVATAWLVVAKIASSAHVCGFKSNYLDLTTAHNGVLTGVGNMIATFASTVSPLLGGSVLDGSRRGWTTMFMIIGALDVGAALFWVVFASGDSIDDKVALKDDEEEEPLVKGSPIVAKGSPRTSPVSKARKSAAVV
jgi:MFS family permease